MTSTAIPARDRAVTNSTRIKRGYRRRLRRGDMLETLVYFSVAIVLALFLADGGARYFLSLNTAVTGIGIVTGLIGSDLMLIMLVLAARVPVIDRTFGHDRALAVHRKLGKPVLYLILAHMLLLLIGYAIADQINPIAEAISLIGGSTDVLFAFVATGFMVLVVVTSLVIVRKKLPYPFWYTVHLLVYGAVLAALPHQFTTGQLFADGTWARWYWMALYVGSLALITIFRVIVPIARSMRHQLRVASVDVEAPGVVSITLSGRHLNALPAKGGQFFNWRFWAPGLWWDSHPYSLSAAPDGRSLRITVRDLGDSSRKLLKLRPGTAVSIEGPYGLFTQAARTKAQVVYIGAGIGITPLRAMLEDAPLQPLEATVILRGGTDDQVYLWQEVYDLCVAKHANLRVQVGHRPVNMNTWMSATAIADGESLLTLAPDIRESDIYICGPTAWAKLVERDVRRLGISEHQIHLERFDY